MRVIIVTQKEPFFIPIVLSSIKDSWKNHIDALIFLKPNEYKNKFSSFFYYLNFWGFKQLLKFGLKFLKLKFKKNINLNGIEIIENININSNEFIEKAKNVDYVLSIAANQIFREEILNAPKEICLNIHAGLLPKYKGFNPSFWVLYNNEATTGMTLHKMDKELDNGPIIRQDSLKILANETWFSLQNRVALKASEMLNNILPKLIAKNLILKKQTGESSLFRKPQVKNGKEFRKRGKRFI